MKPLDPIDAVKSVQEIMRQAGTYFGETDGIIGPQSRSALDRLGNLAEKRRKELAKPQAPAVIVAGKQRVRQMTYKEIRAQFGEPGRSHTLERVVIPQLVGKPWYKEGSADRVSSQGLLMHPEFGKVLVPFFEAVQDAGLLRLVLTVDGIYNNRAVRGGKLPSRHAWGIALDINAPWNGLGVTPAATGWKGTVRPLVPIAEEFGLYWGGYFRRPDGMHFELGVKI